MVLYRRDTVRPMPIGYNQMRVRELMEHYDFDAILLSSPENVFYASGLPVRHHAINPILYALRNQYPSIVLIYADGRESLILWDIYDRNLTWISDVKGCLTIKDALRALKRFIKKQKLATGVIGVDGAFPFYITHFLHENFPNLILQSAAELLLDLQLIKSEEEIRRISESTRIAETAILEMIEATEPGITDIELIKIGKKAIIEADITSGIQCEEDKRGSLK
ncbi:MAG: aminopeptidase P family N-terminal domain-containing protein [Candidatus Helarchaeota archaeon]